MSRADAEAWLGKAMRTMARVEDPQQQEALRLRARQHTVAQWRLKSLLKVSSVGALTGAVGGPVGLALEVTDTAYLFSMAGQACYGVGHILGRPVDYETDMPLILAIWGGAARPIHGTGEDREIAIHVAEGAGVGAGTRVVSKSAFKAGGKLATRVAGIVGAKLAARYGAKLGTRWIPLLGSVTSGGVNWWLVDGLINAARRYYEAEYVLLDNELGQEIITTAVSKE